MRRLRRKRRLLWSLFVVVPGVVAVASAPARTTTNETVYTGVPVAVTKTAAIDVRALARLDLRRKHVAHRFVLRPTGVPEPQERAEPNAGTRPPSQSVAPSIRTALSALTSPYVSASFRAQADAPPVGTRKTEAPPDTNGAVGRDKLMVPLNSNYVIERKSDGKELSRVSMDTFWRPVGAHEPFDPHVLYDPYSDRWLATAGDDPLLPSSLILYGISDTADPQGGWHLFAIQSDPTGDTWADFPTIGFNQSTVVIGVNMFARDSLTYVRGRLIVLDYASLRAGGNGNPSDIGIPDGFALQPAVTYSPTEGTLYLVEHLVSLDATYRFWALRDRTLALVGGAAKTSPLGPWGTPGPSNILPQSDGRGVEAGDSRIGNAVFRNGHVYYAQTIALPPGGTGYNLRTAVQWAELDTNGDFVQGGRIEDPRTNPWNGGHSYAWASLAVNAQNDVLVGFSDFESDDFVDAAYAYRAGSDPPGTMRKPSILKNGEGPYDKTAGGARNRWGDYSGAQVDPSDDLALWTVQEYARIPVGRGGSSGRWGTWWGRVGGGPALPVPQCVVPKVVGKPLVKAWRRIADANCRLGKVRRVRSAKKLKGRVLRQRPAAGKRLPRDSKISLTLGRT